MFSAVVYLLVGALLALLVQPFARPFSTSQGKFDFFVYTVLWPFIFASLAIDAAKTLRTKLFTGFSLTLAATAFFMVTASHARAHEAAAWIQNNKLYVDIINNSGAHCCGVHDCEPAADGAVLEIPGGYQIVDTGEFIPTDKTYFTEGHAAKIALFWRCVRSDGKTRCLFVPGRSS